MSVVLPSCTLDVDMTVSAHDWVGPPPNKTVQCQGTATPVKGVSTRFSSVLDGTSSLSILASNQWQSWMNKKPL